MPSRTEEANVDSHHDGQHTEGPSTTQADASHSSRPVRNDDSLSVAIVGGGIVGIILALGLIDRGMHVAVYERASDFNEIGAGIAFTGVTRECMTKLSPSVIASLKRVANENQLQYDNYWDGFHNDEEDAKPKTPESTLLFQLPNAKMSWWSCLRSHFLDDLAKALPSDIIHFGKELLSYSEPDPNNSSPVTLHFTDTTTATCDILIGCDGIRSRVRQQLFSNTHPQACQPQYTHKTCYRAVIPMAAAESALGESKAHNHCMHTGPGAHILSYPIAQHTLLNVVIFLSDSDSDLESSNKGNNLVRNRDAILSRLKSWRPEVRALISQIPETPLVWRIDDTADHPAPWYTQGRVCLAGDAAHASSPHHGAGAGFGVEDALALATALGLVDEAEEQTQTADAKRGEAVAAALGAYNDVRYARTQWLVRSSRETGDIYEWMYPGSGSDPVKLREEIAARQKVIWDFDVAEMVEETRRRYHARLGGE
ncbi:FAD/NAD(P)-binding domain-containing protein [Annulohypoxylon maeteangense]|uniref:FAD/NAD(P)-binding domain-containing protein n=1 Tax=Annulohypoxylon maeteangense TaxID=1927788 RepID=UPI00200861A2|nr:FAD/NAD(P)-binding domain-containing protein [Annulohypoxylon maeteangense]KAI0885861.1 FAD/NAD(P)-binding domain-containing protein [Annulohypoxylon maeteangense]